jgi:hypothetical protein
MILAPNSYIFDQKVSEKHRVKHIKAKFQVLTTESMKMAVFWDVAS